MKPSRPLPLLLLAVLPLLLVPPAAHAYARVRWDVRVLTRATGDQYGLQASGERLAWAGMRDAGGRVYAWRAGDAGPCTLTVDPRTFGDSPSLSGDRVAWAAGYVVHDDGSIERGGVWTWTPAEGVRPVAPGPAQDVVVSGGRIAWLLGRDITAHSPAFDVLTWTAGSGVTTLTPRAFHCGPPGTSAGMVAFWYRPDPDVPAGDIFSWRPRASSLLTVSPTVGYGIRTLVSGCRLVWATPPTYETGIPAAVYTWTAQEGVVRVSAASGDPGALTPDVSGDRIVWAAATAAGTRDVYTWTPAGGTRRIATGAAGDCVPRVSGDRVVWAAGPAGRRQVYTWTPAAGIERVTRDGNDDVSPVVAGDRVSWLTKRTGGFYQVVTATPRTSRSLHRALRARR